MRILYTGGGTGGHIYPIVAVAEKAKKLARLNNIELEEVYLGAPEDFSYLLEQSGIKVQKIMSAKKRKYFDPRNLLDLPKFFISIIQAFWKVFWIMPDVLFSKGGPGSYPVVLACSFYHIPIMIHESDSIPGKANFWACKKAMRIGISFASARDEFINYFQKPEEKQRIESKIALVGNPVRDFFVTSQDDINKAIMKKSFGFDEQKPLILVICGSQGAVRINDFFLLIAANLTESGIQVLHQTGIKNFEGFNNELRVVLEGTTHKANYKSVPYFDKNIKDAYLAADLIISRAGSGSIAEISVMGRPSILVPIPDEVVGAHQIKNAFEYSQTGAAIMIEEENLKAHIFIDQIKKVLNDSSRYETMSTAAKKFSMPKASEIIATELLNLSQ